MITKSDFQAVQERLIAEERARLGDPPTVETMLAYTRGELNPEEEERVRALLVCYPDLARGLAEPFPAQDSNDGVPELTDAEFAPRWAALQARMNAEGAPAAQGTVVSFADAAARRWRRASAALAAGLMLAVGGLLWQGQRTASGPMLTKTVSVTEGNSRGAGGVMPVTPAGKAVGFRLQPGRQDILHWRLELVNAETSAVLWSEKTDLDDDGAFHLTVPSAMLQPGRYQVIAYSVGSDGKEQRETEFNFRIPSK